ncbi:hypothetical protein [Geopseudomonas aromaticivorans]
MKSRAIVFACLASSLFSAAASAESTTDTTVALAQSLPEASAAELCKAGIATVMDRPAEGIEIGSSGKLVSLNYRGEDGSRWRFMCKIKGDQIVWSSLGGAWRHDESMTYAVKGENLEITGVSPDGANKVRSFALAQLK